MRSITKHSRIVSCLLALAIGSVVTGCSSGGDDPADGNASRAGTSKVLRVATYAGFPPITYKNEQGTITGSDIEIATAIAKKMGMKVSFTNVPFEEIIPGLLGDRFDMAISDISDTKERQEQVDFVDYQMAFTSIVVPKGNPGNVTGMDSLCGEPIAAQTSSSQYPMLTAQSKKCVAEGKPAIKIHAYPGADQVDLALKSGRSYAQVRDFVLGRYQAEHSGGKLEMATQENGAPIKVNTPSPVGIAFAKNRTDLRDKVRATLQSLIDDGTYAKILKSHDLQDTAIDKATINAGEN